MWILSLLSFNQWMGVVVAVAALVLVVRLGVRVIGPSRSGLPIKRFGRELPAGHGIAPAAEAGHQARMRGPGSRFPVWRWPCRGVKVPAGAVEPVESTF